MGMILSHLESQSTLFERDLILSYLRDVLHLDSRIEKTEDGKEILIV